MNDHLKLELQTYCHLVNTGTKPLSCIAIQDRYIAEAVKLIGESGLHDYVEFLAEGWVTVFIYKHDYFRHIIKHLPDAPTSPYDHWVLGKAFGYSDEAIGEYIETQRSDSLE